MSSREELLALVARVRSTTPQLAVELRDIEEHGSGVVADAIIVTEDVWRLALAICVGGGLIEKIRAFRERAAAVAWLEN